MVTHRLSHYDVVHACSYKGLERRNIFRGRERPEETQHRLQLGLEVKVLPEMCEGADSVEGRVKIGEVYDDRKCAQSHSRRAGQGWKLVTHRMYLRMVRASGQPHKPCRATVVALI